MYSTVQYRRVEPCGGLWAPWRSCRHRVESNRNATPMPYERSNTDLPTRSRRLTTRLLTWNSRARSTLRGAGWRPAIRRRSHASTVLFNVPMLFRLARHTFSTRSARSCAMRAGCHRVPEGEIGPRSARLWTHCRSFWVQRPVAVKSLTDTIGFVSACQTKSATPRWRPPKAQTRLLT